MLVDGWPPLLEKLENEDFRTSSMPKDDSKDVRENNLQHMMAARQHRQLPSETFLNPDAHAIVEASVTCSCIEDQADYFVENLP